MNNLLTCIVFLTFFTSQIKCNPDEKEPLKHKQNTQVQSATINDTVRITRTKVGELNFDENCEYSYFKKYAIKVGCKFYKVDPCTRGKVDALTAEGVIPKEVLDEIFLCPRKKGDNESKVQSAMIKHNDAVYKINQIKNTKKILEENCNDSRTIILLNKILLKTVCDVYTFDPCTEEKAKSLKNEGIIPKVVFDNLSVCDSNTEENWIFDEEINENKVQSNANYNDTVNKINQTEIPEQKLEKQCDNSTKIPYMIKIALRTMCKMNNFDPCTKEKLKTLTNVGGTPIDVLDKILICSSNNEDFNEPIIKNKDVSNVFNGTNNYPHQNVSSIINPKSNCEEGYIADKNGNCRERI